MLLSLTLGYQEEANIRDNETLIMTLLDNFMCQVISSKPKAY